MIATFVPSIPCVADGVCLAVRRRAEIESQRTGASGRTTGMTRTVKVVIAGGSGQIETILARAFHGEGHEVVVLSRKPRSAPWGVAAWDARMLGAWDGELEGAA